MANNAIAFSEDIDVNDKVTVFHFFDSPIDTTKYKQSFLKLRTLALQVRHSDPKVECIFFKFDWFLFHEVSVSFHNKL